MRIAVIGAGPMGLAVAYQLVREGHTPIVYEADDRIGGMSAMFDFGGVRIERYYHFHCLSDQAFMDVLDELGLREELVWVSTKMGYWHRGRIQPWGNPWALLRFEGLSFMAKARYALHAFVSTRREHWEDLERYDARTWIRRWVGEEAFEVLWSKLLGLKFYHYAHQLSAPWIWSRIRRIGRSRASLMEERLGYVRGGSATLLEAMHRYILDHGGEVHLNTPIEAILTHHHTLQGLRVHGEELPFERVVSTIALPLVASLLHDPTPYDRYANIACICVIVKLDRPLSENFWLNVNDDAMDIPGIIEYGNLNPDVGHILYLPYYMPREDPRYHDPDTLFYTKAQRYLQTLNPEATILEIALHRYAYAQPICSPRFLETLPPVSTPITGLWIADTSYYYPEDRGISESIGYGRTLARRVIA